MKTIGFIERFWENFLKAGKDKLTHLTLSIHLAQLKFYRERFFKNDNVLEECVNIEPIDYSTQEVFAKIEEYSHLS